MRNSTLNRLKGAIAARCGKLVGYLPLPQPQVLRHATRMTIAAILAFAAAWAFALPEGYWAVISAVVVMQSSLGGTLGAGLDRLTATVAGAMVGAARIPAWACALARGRGDDADRRPNGSATLRPSFRLAPITAVIVLVGAPPEPGC